MIDKEYAARRTAYYSKPKLSILLKMRVKLMNDKETKELIRQFDERLKREGLTANEFGEKYKNGTYKSTPVYVTETKKGHTGFICTMIFLLGTLYGLVQYFTGEF